MSAPAWLAAHRQAVIVPNDVERPFIELLAVIGTMVDVHGQDQVLRVGVADLITGARVLLNAERGRLDGGSLDASLVRYAERIGFDLDTESWTS